MMTQQEQFCMVRDILTTLSISLPRTKHLPQNKFSFNDLEYKDFCSKLAIVRDVIEDLITRPNLPSAEEIHKVGNAVNTILTLYIIESKCYRPYYLQKYKTWKEDIRETLNQLYPKTHLITVRRFENE